MSEPTPLPTPDFTRYYRFDDLTAHLHALVAARPELAQITSIGQSLEGRDLWLVTLTNRATGEPLAKPAYWIDGNTHAGEVTGSTACLYTIWRYLADYGSDPRVTDLLDHQTTYILPRLCPDGAERYLTTPTLLRSSIRPYPFVEEPEGLVREDIDGDGQILQMRIIDPNGAWKVSDRDPRIMRPRGFDETGGMYYTIVPEGTIRNYDGWRFSVARSPFGIDMNRNYPHQWGGQDEEPGGGPYPLSEPEVRAEMDCWRARRNINGFYSYHTSGGVLLRPFSTQSDDAIPLEDLAIFRQFGERGQAITGYRHASTYHDFRYDPRDITHGCMDDTAYDLFGWFGFTAELWDMPAEAGIKDRKWIEWDQTHPEEDDLALLHWNDEVLGEAGFVNWHAFEHPQLGQVELGGWPPKTVRQNPPPQFLERICAKHAQCTLALALAAPRLTWARAEVTPLGADLWHITALLVNTGFLPTDTSRQARHREAVRPIILTLALPDGATLIMGEARAEIGQLEGRSANAQFLGTADAPDVASHKAEWTVRAATGSAITLVAVGERAGTVRVTLTC
jgi:murein tripeptide amidase MpaA